ncbi:MAG: hypothetical protein ACK5P3_04120, partial [Dolichospermum sp.]
GLKATTLVTGLAADLLASTVFGVGFCSIGLSFADLAVVFIGCCLIIVGKGNSVGTEIFVLESTICPKGSVRPFCITSNRSAPLVGGIKVPTDSRFLIGLADTMGLF